MQRVGVWINGGRWRGIVSTPSLVWWFQREVGHEILERSKRRPFSAESKQVPRWKNVLATNEGLSLSREGLCRGSWWTGVCPGQPSSLSAVLLSRPLSSDHARNTRCCPLLLSLSFGYRQSSPLLSHANNLSSRLERVHHFLTRRIFNELYKVVENFCRKDNIFISTWNFTIWIQTIGFFRAMKSLIIWKRFGSKNLDSNFDSIWLIKFDLIQARF